MKEHISGEEGNICDHAVSKKRITEGNTSYELKRRVIVVMKKQKKLNENK